MVDKRKHRSKESIAKQIATRKANAIAKREQEAAWLAGNPSPKKSPIEFIQRLGRVSEAEAKEIHMLTTVVMKVYAELLKQRRPRS